MSPQKNASPQRYVGRPPGEHQQRGVDARARDQSWPGTWMVIGIFVLIVSFWWVGTRTLISYTALGRWFALFAFAGNLLPYAWVGLRLGMERLEWFLFNLLAVGPTIFSLLLWLNLLVHGPERFAVAHYPGTLEDLRRFWMTTGTLPPMTPVPEELSGLVDELLKDGPIGEHLIGTAKGVLGYEVIVTYERFGGAVP